jgi:hypothetical protein
VKLYSVSGAACEVGLRLGVSVPPRVISDALYQRRLDRARCPIVGKQHVIPEDYMPEVERVVSVMLKLSAPAV